MEKDILARLQRNLSTYSKSRRAIAMYLLGAPVQSALMTAKQLADAVGVSEATVVRFATELGYSGYPQMRQDMRAQWIAGESAAAPVGDCSQTTMHADAQAIQSTVLSLEQKTVQAAMNGILQSKRLFVFGLGIAAPVAAILADALHEAFRDVHKILSPDASTICRELMHISREDAVIAVCADAHRETAQLMDFCRSSGAFHVVLCREQNGAAYPRCNALLLVQSGRSLASLVSAAHMLADALIKQQKENAGAKGDHNR